MSDTRRQPAETPPLGSSVASTNCVMDLVNSEFQLDCSVPSLMVNVDVDAPRARRSVSINPLSTLCLYDAPEPEDSFKMWYTEEDEEVSKANTWLEASVLRQMQRGEPVEGISLHPDNLTVVGLEKYLLSPEVNLKRLRLKSLIKYTVLMEQARGCEDEDKAERIACLAMRLSKWSVDQAKSIGKLQQRESDVKM